MKNASDQTIRLKVTEGLGKDVGRSLARMDPIDMKALGVGIGDFVELSGKRKTVCKVMPAFKDDRGGNRIQVDGITRTNASVALDDLIIALGEAQSGARKARDQGLDARTFSAVMKDQSRRAKPGT